MHTGNELASLTRRDADIAVRATKRPPLHLVGKRIGAINVALFAAKAHDTTSAVAPINAATATWIAPEGALPDHPSVVWRKHHLPNVVPRYRVDSILSVCELVALGLGVGLLPTFLAQQRTDLRQVSQIIEECQTELWLLAHPQSRHLRHIAVVYGHLSRIWHWSQPLRSPESASACLPSRAQRMRRSCVRRELKSACYQEDGASIHAFAKRAHA